MVEEGEIGLGKFRIKWVGIASALIAIGGIILIMMVYGVVYLDKTINSSFAVFIAIALGLIAIGSGVIASIFR